MGRRSPLGIEGTSINFRDPDAKGRATVLQARAKDDAGAWQSRRFAVTSWKRDGTPLVPEEAVDWARATRRSFVREEAVARAATFQEFAKLLVANLEASGVKQERLSIIRSVAKALADEGICDMRSDIFPVRVRDWITGLDAGWSLPPGAKNRRLTVTRLSPATRNKLLTICRQVTGIALRKRRIAFDPLAEIPRFKEAKVVRATFTIAELRKLVSEDVRNHIVQTRDQLAIEIDAQGKPRDAAIRAVAERRKCHWSSIYNALARPVGPDPWWLACCLLIYTGCRADEAIHLRWEWIKWDSDIIHLELAADYENKSNAERFIPLEPELKAILLPLAKPAGHILAPEIRAGGSGIKKRAVIVEGAGSHDYTQALRLFLARVGVDAKNRTAHSFRHTYISIKMARADTNVERLRKSVGHADFSTTMGYGTLSQLYEGEVDQWPDGKLWLRRSLTSDNVHKHAK